MEKSEITKKIFRRNKKKIYIFLVHSVFLLIYPLQKYFLYTKTQKYFFVSFSNYFMCYVIFNRADFYSIKMQLKVEVSQTILNQIKKKIKWAKNSNKPVQTKLLDHKFSQIKPN
jgi:hypothetical protein